MGRENYMALIKCPKCGRENVSNSAERCPSCGYNIKEYYDKSHEKDNENKRIVLGIGIVILVFAVLFLKKESFTTHDADPFKKYYSNFGKDISTVNKSKKYIISSTSDHYDIENDLKVYDWDELSNMKIELFYRPCIKTMMISFSTNE